jgi:predicted DNA-binding protein (UPF0251 family)
MARPCKCRRVRGSPGSYYYKPAGVPVSALEEVNLTMDEFESIRLSDLKGMYQEQAAKRMNISRQTFGNIIESARRKVADALTGGKALRIEGGIVEMDETRTFNCHDCGNKWETGYGAGRPQSCPKCGSANIHRTGQVRGLFRKGKGNFSLSCRRTK